MYSYTVIGLCYVLSVLTSRPPDEVMPTGSANFTRAFYVIWQNFRALGSVWVFLKKILALEN